MRLKITIVLISACIYCSSIYAQSLELKTNLLYEVGALAPNATIETNIASNITFNITGSYNRWNVKTYWKKNNQKLAHWYICPEFRFWFNPRLTYGSAFKRGTRGIIRHRRNRRLMIDTHYSNFYVGVYPFYAEYNISKHNLPFLFGDWSGDYRFQGNIMGAGISTGYAIPLNDRFRLELGIGFGGGHMIYDKYEYQKHGNFIDHEQKMYWGITKLSVSIGYAIF